MVDNSKMTYQQRVDYLAKCTPAQWDALCKRCGVCCLEKVDVGHLAPRGTVFTHIACEHLDIKTKQCRIYHNRIAACNGECRRVDLDMLLHDQYMLPDSCGYIEFLRGPARFPATVDWTRVRNAAHGDTENPILILSNMIMDSVKWICR